MSNPDETKTRIPANENPWYCLATLHGNQPEGDVNAVLHKKNCETWNRWAAGALDVTQRSKLLEKGQFKKDELKPLNQKQRYDLEQQFHRRIGREGADLPNPKDPHDFSNIDIDNAARFGGFVFPRRANFSNAVFSGIANFEGAVFSGAADFESAGFSDWANFGSAAFSQSANFQNAAFSSVADFESAAFSSVADFQNAAFSSAAVFRSAAFSGISFESAAFSQSAYFQNAAFSSVADFQNAAFSSVADFQNAAFSGWAYFQNAAFSSEAEFRNVRFDDRTSFNKTGFKSSPPTFFHATLNQDTDWPESKMWPRPSGKESAREFVRAYERLKLEMDNLRKIEDELTFLALELQSKAVRDGGGRAALIVAYRVLSDYGRSVLRPLGWLGVVWVLGWLLSFASGCLSLWQASAASASNLVPFFGFSRAYLNPDMIQMLPYWVKLAFACQTVLSAPLLFLLLLAIRNRFRIK